jgi:hypothetical protein
MEVGKYYRWSMWDKDSGMLLVQSFSESDNEVVGVRTYGNGDKIYDSRHYLRTDDPELHWIELKAYNSPLWKVMND